MDTKAIETHIRGILEAIGEDPDREGLRETPQRVARMYEEIFAGVQYSNHEIAEMFGKTFDAPSPSQSQTAVVMKDISVFSYCEHHMALMYDMKVNVAYVPRGRVIGLSKIARICDMASKRLQLQERPGTGYRRDFDGGGGNTGRWRSHHRLAQLHDGSWHPQRLISNHNENLLRRIPDGSRFAGITLGG